MQVDLLTPISAVNASATFLRRLGPAVEERGFGGLWVPEHVVLFDDYESRYPYTEDGRLRARGDTGVLEPFAALTFLAAVTDRIRLGTAVCLIPQRNPVYTAKQVADLDVLSNGRVDLGIGVGWLREEFEALGVPWERRGARADDHLAVMRSLWTEAVSSHDGDLYTLPPSRLYPKPVQAPVPVHVGGESPAALRRVARAGQGWFTFNRTPEEVVSAVETLEEALAAEGRSRHDDDFTLTVSPGERGVTSDEVAAYTAAGVDRLAIAALILDETQIEPVLDTLAETAVRPASRGQDHAHRPPV